MRVAVDARASHPLSMSPTARSSTMPRTLAVYYKPLLVTIVISQPCRDTRNLTNIYNNIPAPENQPEWFGWVHQYTAFSSFYSRVQSWTVEPRPYLSGYFRIRGLKLNWLYKFSPWFDVMLHAKFESPMRTAIGKYVGE